MRLRGETRDIREAKSCSVSRSIVTAPLESSCPHGFFSGGDRQLVDVRERQSSSVRKSWPTSRNHREQRALATSLRD